MSSMNELLAAHYGTNGVKTASAAAAGPTAEDLEKDAQMDLFCKMAAANGLDLNTLTDAQVEKLYADTFSTKTAGELPPQFAAHAKGKGEHEEKEEKDEVEEKAKKEHEEKKAMAEKLAEADYVGRAMAHAYVQELGLIASAREKQASVAKGGAVVEADGTWQVAIPKVASAIDQLAIPQAYAIVQEFNKTAAADQKIDEKTAAEKIAAVHIKGLPESTKIAGAADHKSAIYVRALETLEAAGYPVNWDQK
jgi:hypothetical protein